LNQILERGATTDAERQYCELLSLLIEDFEKKNYQLTAKATPLAALRELMEVNGLQQKDLLDVFKHKAVISEVLNGKRGLTLEHIRRLARRFHLSVEVFI
jgi:HTH-type transcriptional regulator/antitoxin HigA